MAITKSVTRPSRAAAVSKTTQKLATAPRAATSLPAGDALLNLVEQSNGRDRKLKVAKVQLHRSTGGTRGGRRTSCDGDKHTVDQVMQFEIYGADHPDVRSGKQAPDDMLVALLKEEINSAGICRRDLYAFVGTGPGMLFENENQAYNLEYGLRGRSTISLECAKRWLTVLGKELVIEFRPIPED